MMHDSKSGWLSFAVKNRYLLLLLLAGIVLILLPGGNTGKQERAATEEEQRLQAALEHLEGVGEVCVLLAEAEGRSGGCTGAVILCQGADAAEVRLHIVEAVSAFTGLGSNRILVLKMKN